MANPHLPFPREAYAEKGGGKGLRAEGFRDRGRGGERQRMQIAYVCACPGAVCHAHFCDLQLMKLGCSRVACQINMPRTSLPFPSPPSVLSYSRLLLSSPPTDYLSSSFSTPALTYLIVALLRESFPCHDRCAVCVCTL